MIQLIPNLRAFAISLAGRKDGDDLAQDALAKAWRSRERYERGTNLKAWVFTILRNQFYSERRRSWRSLPLEQNEAEQILVAHDDLSSREDLLDVRNAMELLPHSQREALILAGPAGLSYEDIAKICGCAVGTVKSRVSRARGALSATLERRKTGRRARTEITSSQAFEEIMWQSRSLIKKLKTA